MSPEGAAAWAEVDLAAIAANVRRLREAAGSAEVMAVVKANAYGHGLVPAARAAREGGAAWLGVAFISEALDLRAAGDTGPVLAWLHPQGAQLASAVVEGVDISVSGTAGLARVVEAAGEVGRRARVHLKFDTGLWRGGAPESEWADLVTAAVRARRAGAVEVVGLWSHVAFGDDPWHDSVTAQAAAFDRACGVAGAAGIRDALLHLSSSGPALARPALAHDLVRPGLAVYGVSPGPSVGGEGELGLRPAMTLRSTVAQVKDAPAGIGVSYSHRYRTAEPTRLALVPLGYADGIPRSASGTGPLLVGGTRCTVAGAVCMDQVVVDLGPGATVEVGDPVTVFGPGDAGEPTVAEWAAAAGTIPYEVLTGIGPRVPRVHLP